MGLDIYHFHLKDEVTDDPIIIDVSQPQLRNIIHFSRKKTNQYFDHARLLSDHSFSPQDYRLVFQQRQLGATGKFETDDFYFSAADEPDPMNPTRTGLYFTSRRGFLLKPKPHLPPSARKKVKTFQVRQFPMEDRLDDVVYGVSVGYQRKDVVDDFFNEFPPDCSFAERRYAERIFELTVPEARQDFRSNFLDNWDDRHSLVVVSW